MTKDVQKIFIAVITGILAGIAFSYYKSEKKNKKIFGNDFESDKIDSDKENLSKDLGNIYSDMINAKKQITSDAQN